MGRSSGHVSEGPRILVAMFEDRPDIQERLDREIVIWMTTVSPAGQAQSSPVWFNVEDDVIVVYSVANSPRTRNIAANPRVALNLNSSEIGDDLVIIEGVAEIVEGGPPADHDERYLAKYESELGTWNFTVESFTRDYPVRIHVSPTRLRAS